MYSIPPTAQQIQDQRGIHLEVATAVFAIAGALLGTHAMGQLTHDPIWALVTEWMGTAFLLVSGWELFKLVLGKNYFSALPLPTDNQKVEKLFNASSYGQFYLEEVRAQGRSYTYGEWQLARYWASKETRSKYLKRLH